MNKFCLSMYVCLSIFSCQSGPSLDGHWHLAIGPSNLENKEILAHERYREDLEYIVLDIDGDKGILNRKPGQSEGLEVSLEDSKTKLVLSIPGCYFREYSLSLKDTILYVLNQGGETSYIGYRCEKKCCNLQMDYYSDDKGTSINL